MSYSPLDGDDEAAAVYSQIVAMVDKNTRFLANPDFLLGRTLVPQALNANSPHRRLHEITENPTSPSLPPIQKEMDGYILGMCGTNADGLHVGAAGSLSDDVTIDDSTHVKLHIPLKPLGASVAEIENIWIDQSVGSHELIDALVGGKDRRTEIEENPTVFTRPMLRFSSGSNFSTDTSQGRLRNETFPVVSHDLYDVKFNVRGRGYAQSEAPTRTTRKRTRGAAALDDNDNDGGPSAAADSAADINADMNTSLRPKSITTASKYDPNCLDDHVGPRFHHVTAKVNQFDIRDIDNTLIPPWKYAKMFLPGAILIVCAAFYMWEMPPKGNMSKTSLTFQPQFKTIKFLRRGVTPTSAARASIPPTTVTEHSVPLDVATDFDDFCIKLDHRAGLVSNSKDILMPDVTQPPLSTVAKGKRRKV